MFLISVWLPEDLLFPKGVTLSHLGVRCILATKSTATLLGPELCNLKCFIWISSFYYQTKLLFLFYIHIFTFLGLKMDHIYQLVWNWSNWSPWIVQNKIWTYATSCLCIWRAEIDILTLQLHYRIDSTQRLGVLSCLWPDNKMYKTQVALMKYFVHWRNTPN